MDFDSVQRIITIGRYRYGRGLHLSYMHRIAEKLKAILTETMLVLQQRRSVLHLLVSTISIVLLCHETVPINAFARTSGIHVPLHHAVVRIRESRSSIGAKQDVENDDDSVSFMDVVYGSVQNVASVTAKKVEEDVLRDGFLLDWLGNLTNAERDKDDGDQREEESISDAKDLVSDEMSNTVDDNDAVSAEYLDRVLEQARKEATSEDTGDFAGILKVLNTHIKQVKEALSKHLGDLEYENIQPASLYYYLKHEEKRKDDDWKRQAHSEFPPFDIHEEKEALVEMFAFMIMCQTAYCESQEEVELCLSEVAPNRYELIYEEDTKTPNQPAHFIVIDRGETNAEEGVVEVRLVVRGTKTLTDAITDLLCDAVDYRGFKAHSGILESGTYLASQHAPLFQKLLDSPGTEKIHLTIIVSITFAAE